MFSKRGRPWEAEALPPDRRLRANLADLFVSNDVSAARAQSIFADAEASGARNVADLAKAGHTGKHKKNLARDLTRKLLKNSQWPRPYNAQVRTWNAKAEKVELQEVPVLLPHEIVWAMTKDGSTSEHLLRGRGPVQLRQDRIHRRIFSECPWFPFRGIREYAYPPVRTRPQTCGQRGDPR